MTARRLPGIEFIAAPPARPEALPRMDIAVFVGFASTGPLHVPVALEGVSEYANVFGADAPLAWDCARGERIHAHLGPSVRAFFSNGGRRCWVIRVARGAVFNWFPLDGVMAAWTDDFGPHIEPAFALARCEGSWSDALRVQTALQESPMEIDSLQAGPGSTFTFHTRSDVAAGDVLELTHDSGLRVFARVEGVVPDGPTRRVTLDRVVSFLQGERVDRAPPALYSSAKVLALDVRASGAGGNGATAAGRGLARGHPRAWMDLPTDEELFTANPNAASLPRFPLAGRTVAQDAWLIPLAVGAGFGEARGPIAQAPTALERDGLAEFDPRLFLDPDLEFWQPGTALAPKDPGVLAEQADYLRYSSPTPRKLSGIHAALGFDAGVSDEATLICVPDAVHPGWEPALRATGGPEASPPAAPSVPAGTFSECEIAKVPAPQFDESDPNPGQSPSYTLAWSAVPGASCYEVEASRYPDHRDARTVYEGADRRLVASGQGNGRYYYRVRACVAGVPGGWSQGIAVDVHVDSWQMRSGEGYADDDRGRALLDLHRALLRMCGAKGELFAVLSLPGHYREREAIAHATRLRTGPGETSAATYGALYHPWPVDRRADASYFAFPPDGPVMGVLAARAFERGAWIAPANEVMNAFVALRPVVPAESWPALLGAQVNVLRLDARGFVLMSEDTLAADDDAELRPICVRRLLILLRRLALRRGANYVFEPNDDVLRRTVQRSFHEALSELHARGAFAGATPALSFQVITDETINTPRDGELGRFFVELKVAPSLPLSFLSVRLRQRGERLTASEGR